MKRTLITILWLTAVLLGQAARPVRLVKIADNAYASTSVNAPIFRTSPLATHGHWQYAAYYDTDGYLTLAKRRLNKTQWQVQRSDYKGNVADGHNAISLAVDGKGILHVAFDHHGNALRYSRSVKPGSLTLGPLLPMVGRDEADVTYPEFYALPSGGLLFAYRSGASGRGNLVMNIYKVKSGEWSRLHDVLIDGENERNAYWQLHIDTRGTLHLSWVWRETWMVETNHDLCYARSRDGGLSWERSDGTPYQLPITAATAEYAWRIPQGSELINQTSMTADPEGHPYIATYWRDADSTIPQYRVVRFDGEEWKMMQVGQRTTPFTLAGGGTKRIPISRPRMVCDGQRLYFFFREEEREDRVTMAQYDLLNAEAGWRFADLTDFAVGTWEPSMDLQLWNTRQQMHLYLQRCAQGDGEKVSPLAPQPAYVLEVQPQSAVQVSTK
jgi:hypothetical protein